MFCHDSNSPSQLIQHSFELRHVYKKCCAKHTLDAAVSTVFGNLRAAKHRIETYVRPLSRCILNITALIAFCNSVSIMRKGTNPGKACAAFLMHLTMEIILIAAMMADAGAEVMALIRIFDTELVITAVMVEAIYDFLNRITWLFYEGGVFVVDGHTKFILGWAQSQHFFLVDGGGRSLGGTPITDVQKSTALAPMKAWVKLAKATLEAEFPSTGLVHAFGVFALPKSTAEAAR